MEEYKVGEEYKVKDLQEKSKTYVTEEQFRKMGYKQRLELKKCDPVTYDVLDRNTRGR